MSNGTRIPVKAFNGKDFLEVYKRTSQFPQNYREFVFKAARNAYYLGLRVSGRFGSVLNSAVEWRGSYAFHNTHYAFEIEEQTGDMVMLWVSAAATGGGYIGTGGKLAVVKYAASGWASYPATPAFGNMIVLDEQKPDGATGITGLSFARTKGAADVVGAANLKNKNTAANNSAVAGAASDIYIAAWINDGMLSVATGSPDAGSGGFRVQKSQVQADTVSLAAAGSNACIAFHPNANANANANGGGSTVMVEGEVRVDCSTDANAGHTVWDSLGVAIEAAAVVDRLAVKVAVTEDRRVVVAARSADNQNMVVVRWAQLEKGNQGETAAYVWNVADLAAEAPITHFELGSVGNAVHLVVSERNGEGLKVFELVL